MADRTHVAFTAGFSWLAVATVTAVWGLWCLAEPHLIEAEADRIREVYDRLDAEQDRQVREILRRAKR